MSSRGICQWIRNPAKIYPWCMCHQPTLPDEKYCAEHKAERAAEVEKLMEARRRSGRHIDGDAS